MVKFGKNKLKALNKIAKNQKVAASPGVSNKILKKKINAEKKVTFQKEVLKEAVSGNSPLVKNVTSSKIVAKELKKAKKETKAEVQSKKPPKPVEKRKKRQKTQLSDTKLMLKLMKNQSK
ncbi:unnamed protein product [Chrysodeixis includens]|uniref:Uncharacterized protein n=1 Tax=Chrysodeixis includens TaxID=689277 RepID=A0A9N8KVZ9_CHRIL|nr:unnamed protein product [Chrysodeixis includens]